MQKKKCYYCKELKFEFEFYRNSDRCKECERKRSKTRYSNKVNFNLDQYEAMLRNQGGVCAICGKTPKENGRRLAIDHNHTTGEVRELLCDACNTCLGKFNEDIKALGNAIKYLRRHNIGNNNRNVQRSTKKNRRKPNRQS